MPTIDQVLASPTTSYWLKNALNAALQRDAVDAYYDAKLLAELLKQEISYENTVQCVEDL